jgi:hypothetical protein
MFFVGEPASTSPAATAAAGAAVKPRAARYHPDYLRLLAQEASAAWVVARAS